MNTQSTPEASEAPVPAVMNYDPNLTHCENMAVQTVRLTFAMWQYRYTTEVTVGGNCTGLRVISCAIGRVYDGLDEDYPEIRMTHGEDIMLCGDDDNEGEDWLADMLIGAEIIAIQPEAKQ